MNHETVKKALLDRIAESNVQRQQFTQLTMRADGNTVNVEPWKDNSYFVYYGKCGMTKIYKDLDAVVEALISYPADADALMKEEDSYRAENEPKLRAYFAEHFADKTWEEIDGDEWSWYSDWHKDVFGYRPHGIVCGEYINPYTGRKEPWGCA